MDRPRKRESASAELGKTHWELRSLNERAWNGDTDVFPVGKSLDSSLKKNSGFIRRLRTAISAATLDTFLQEIKTLSLHKYLSEVISACYEGLCRLKSPGEVEAGVEIVSALHQRFGPAEFTEYLGWLLGKGMSTPDKGLLKSLAPEAREKKRRSACKGGAAEPFPLEVLKDLLGHDREHANLPLLVIFVKAFSWDILGFKSAVSDGRKTVEEDGVTKSAEEPAEPTNSDDGSFDCASDDPAFTTPELQERFRNILKRYFDDVKAHILRDQKSIAAQRGRNSEAYVKSGEVFEDRQANFERQLKAQERLISNAQIIAEAIGAEMPDLKDSGDSSAATNGSIGLVKTGEYLRGQSDGAGIWQDEDERRFYENLVDLKGKVPNILLEDGKKKKADADDQVGKKAEVAEAETSKVQDVTDDQSTAIANKTIGAQVDALLTRLPEFTSKDVVDETAIDFCFLNSKASRNRLIKALTEVPKGRTDLLPFWSRLVATLGQYMPDVPKGVVEYLDAEFRSLQRRKEKDFLGQVRLSNIRYLAELTKFGIVPEHVVFHCLKVSLDDFSRMNIEIICNLLENCGRYLLRNADTSPRMATFLETLQRKKSVQHIGQAERMLIENAIYYVDPPERAAIQQKERTPTEVFIRKLIYVDMTKRNYTKILKQIRRLHWEEPEVVEILAKVFSKPAKVKYGSIHILAILLSAIYRYHPEFVISVMDTVIESVDNGLEQNDFKYNQRRIAEVKYLGELYNYRMLDHPVIFETLYRVMTFGHGGVPLPGRLNPFDLPDDYFRIRLAATILETCGMFFNRGAAGKKLDYFLSFLQYYIFTKAPLPMDIEFIVQDTFSLTRPQWKLATTPEEASKAFQLAILQDQKNAGHEKAADPEPEDAESDISSDDDGGEGDDDLAPDADKDEESNSEEEDDLDDGETPQSPCDTESEDEAIIVTRKAEEVDPEDEADFEREYAKMMAESLESRKFERKPLFDAPVPVRPKTREAAAANEPEEGDNESPSLNKMAFSLLTKKGNRQQTRMVELPSDSNFAVAMKNQQQAEREEQQRIKNLVLNLDLRETEEADGDTNSNPLLPNANLIHTTRGAGHDKTSVYHLNRPEKPSKERGGQRVRRLQMNDLDWYDNTQDKNQKRPGITPGPASLAARDANAGMASPSIPVDTNKRRVPDGVRQHRRGRANRART
ncbi:mRNA decay protein [Apiospora aurea]|uniref:mRNA decay protein n=1 Tax=Apiospora aurea TaxID=335848 RepID=A0ABR1QJW2_9PEZI